MYKYEELVETVGYKKAKEYFDGMVSEEKLLDVHVNQLIEEEENARNTK